MKKTILFLIFSTLLFATNTTILLSQKTYALIDKNITKGLSGYVVHNDMVIAKALSIGNKKVIYLPFDKLKNNSLANINIFPKKGDKIIFDLYNRGLIIAPNQVSYINAQKKYKNIKFISSDIFANYVDDNPSKENFKNFCKDFSVEKLYFILDKEYIVDCNSFIAISIDANSTIENDYNTSFFTNYTQIKHSFFTSEPKNWIQYYKSLIKENNAK